MSNSKKEVAPAMVVDVADPQRRSLALGLFGALGGAALIGCRTGADALIEGETMQSTQALSMGGSLKCVDSAAELRVTAGDPTSVALLKGYSVPGDGGGGLFFWSPNGALDDGGTVLNPSAQPAAGWRRIYSHPIDIRWFGAVPGIDTREIATANVTAIRRALDIVASSGGRVLVTGGTFFINATITLSGQDSVLIEGPGAPSPSAAHQSALKWSSLAGAGETMLVFDTCVRSGVRHLLVDGGGRAGIGISLVSRGGCDDCLFEDFGISGMTQIGLQVGSATGASCADNTFRRFLVEDCPIGIAQDGGQTSNTVYDGSAISSHTNIGIHLVRGDATVRNVDFQSANPGAGTTYDVRVEDTANCMRFENNNHELGYGGSVAYYFPPNDLGSSARISLTKLDGVRILWRPERPARGKLIDYQQEGPVVAIACQWASNRVVSAGTVTIDWTGAARSTIPVVQEIGCQYVQGITANPGRAIQYFSSLVSNGAFGSAVGLGVNNGAIQLGSTGFGVPIVSDGGGALYVKDGALWFVGPGATPTKLAQG